MSDQGTQITELVEALMAHALGLENLDPLRELLARASHVHHLTDTLGPHLPALQDMATTGRHQVNITVPELKQPVIHFRPTVNVPAQEAPHVHPTVKAPDVHVHPPAKSTDTKPKMREFTDENGKKWKVRDVPETEK